MLVAIGLQWKIVCVLRGGGLIRAVTKMNLSLKEMAEGVVEVTERRGWMLEEDLTSRTVEIKRGGGRVKELGVTIKGETETEMTVDSKRDNDIDRKMLGKKKPRWKNKKREVAEEFRNKETRPEADKNRQMSH